MIYTAILVILIVGFCFSLYLKTSYRVDVLRDRAVMGRITEDGMLENVYRLKIENNTESNQRYLVIATGLKEITMEVDEINNPKNDRVDLNLRAGETRTLVVEVKTPDGAMPVGSHPVKFEIQSLNTDESIVEKSVFIVPSS
jgi:polyferredoxin